MTDETAQPGDTVPLRVVLHGARGRFLLALLLVEFGAGMQGIAYSTVLPVIARDLDGFALFGATLAAGNVAAVLMLSVAGAILARVRPGIVLLAATLLYVVGVACAVAAPSMAWVLAGSIIRGVAAGLLAGFAMGAIGGMFDERERPRVFGLFAFIWLVPSVVGPVLNAAITEWLDWRWALAWPAVIVLAGRAFMGAYIRAVPWERSSPRARPWAGIAVAAFLVVGSAASASTHPWAFAAFVASSLGAAIAIVVFLVHGVHDPRVRRVLIAFAALGAAFFGLYELLSLTVIEGLGSSLLWASVAVTAGLLAWTLAGLRPRPDARPDRAVTGPVLIVLGTVILLGVTALASGWIAIALVVIAAGLAGLGMGLAYPLLSSEPFSDAVPAVVVGPLISFAEVAGTAWAVLVGGGLYSSLHASVSGGAGLAPRAALLVVYAVLLVVAVAAVTVSATRRRATGA
jgi:MFS family permease